MNNQYNFDLSKELRIGLKTGKYCVKFNNEKQFSMLLSCVNNDEEFSQYNIQLGSLRKKGYWEQPYIKGKTYYMFFEYNIVDYESRDYNYKVISCEDICILSNKSKAGLLSWLT